MCSTTLDSYITFHGVQLRRRIDVGPRGGTSYIYQAETASADWGYWYSSATRAAQESNASDRLGTGMGL